MPFTHKALAILLGSLILSIGINFFLSPFEVLDGGIIGIGLIFNYLWGVKAGLTMILFSLPILVLAWFRNRSYFYNSIHGMLVSSFMIDLLEPFKQIVIVNLRLPSIYSSVLGGILVGIGIGIMLRYETSTGGTDLLAQFFADKFRLNVGIVIFLIDLIVILMGGLLVSKETFLLSALAITAVGFATSVIQSPSFNRDA